MRLLVWVALMWAALPSIPSMGQDAKPDPVRWVRLHDRYQYPVHYAWVNYYGNVLGHYFKVPGQTHHFPVIPSSWVARCYTGPQAYFTTESDARAYVVACPVWE